jgi:hypothetical protein
MSAFADPDGTSATKLSLSRLDLSSGRYRALFLSNKSGQRSVTICHPKLFSSFASRMVTCSRGVRC